MILNVYCFQLVHVYNKSDKKNIMKHKSCYTICVRKFRKGIFLMNQLMSHDEWITKAELRNEDGDTWVLNYYLQSFAGENSQTAYGLRIDKSTPDGVLCEREETLAITENLEELQIMAKAFAKGSVPPVTLLEMADDWHSGANLIPT